VFAVLHIKNLLQYLALFFNVRSRIVAQKVFISFFDVLTFMSDPDPNLVPQRKIVPASQHCLTLARHAWSKLKSTGEAQIHSLSL
jgi:hypothetical protein